MKIAAVVILYDPVKDVIRNINSYSEAIDLLYIVDNSTHPSTQIQASFIGEQKVLYLHDGENKGIASRLNQVIGLARNEGYEWLLTMDQDSYFENGMFSAYVQCCRKFENKEKVSLFGIVYSTTVTSPDDCNFSHVNHLITSGSIMNVKLAEQIGGFDENLFIDEVDFEYCLRSVSLGFTILQFQNIFLIHTLGEVSYHRSLKNNKITARVLHSPLRLYYITRNFLYIRAKYRCTFPAEINKRKKILFNRLKNNLLYNKDRFNVLKFIARGILDYGRKRMGKLN